MEQVQSLITGNFAESFFSLFFKPVKTKNDHISGVVIPLPRSFTMSYAFIFDEADPETAEVNALLEEVNFFNSAVLFYVLHKSSIVVFEWLVYLFGYKFACFV